MRIASLLTCVLFLSACDSTPSSDVDSGTPADAASVEGLTCSSFTLCSYAEVMFYASATLPAPAGGTVTPGHYRLAWVETADASRAGVTDDLAALEIAGSSFSWSGGPEGELGTFSVSGTDLTMHYTARCELGAQTRTDDRSFTFQYTATGNELRLYETVSGFAQARVFRRMSDASEVCDLESEAPASAGDSAVCNASNCFCAYAVGGTLAESSCPF